MRILFVVSALLILGVSDARAQGDGRDWNQVHDPYVGGIGAGFGDSKDWNLGAGVGIEFLLWPRWAFKADVSFTWISGEESIYPLPQVALIYYW